MMGFHMLKSDIGGLGGGGRGRGDVGGGGWMTFSAIRAPRQGKNLIYCIYIFKSNVVKN